MMEQLVERIVTWKAIDGTVFSDEEEAKSYENRLPRHLQFCLLSKYTQEQLETHGVWEIGCSHVTARTEYQPPAFLREGGDVTYYDSHDEKMFVVEGSLSDAVAYAVEQESWWRRSNKYVRPVSVVRLEQSK